MADMRSPRVKLRIEIRIYFIKTFDRTAFYNHESLNTGQFGTNDLATLNAFDNCIRMQENNYQGQMFDAETMKKMCENVELQITRNLAPETFF